MTVSQDMVSGAPSKLTIDGVEYEIDPIRQGNVCKTMRWLKARWMEYFLESTRHTPLAAEDRGIAFAAISCKTPTMLEVLDDYEAKLYLLSLSVKMAGKAVTFDHIRDHMEPRTSGVLLDLLFQLSKKPDDEGGADPTTTTTSE